MSATKVKLWFVRETAKARQYSRIPPDRHPTKEDFLWVPISVIEHTTKYPEPKSMPIHIVKLADWFIERSNL